MTLSLNFFIIASFYDLLNEDGQESSNRYTPSLFYGDGNLNNYGTNNIITILGTTQCVCSVLIVSFFIIKTAPLLIKRGWKKHKSKNASKGCLRNLFVKLKNLLLTLYFTLSNVDVLYHLCYMVFSILGLTYPLFFSLHLLDILYRYPSLQNVIKSIVLPRKSLLLTFILILILVYLFSI